MKPNKHHFQAHAADCRHHTSLPARQARLTAGSTHPICDEQHQLVLFGGGTQDPISIPVITADCKQAQKTGRAQWWWETLTATGCGCNTSVPPRPIPATPPYETLTARSLPHSHIPESEFVNWVSPVEVAAMLEPAGQPSVPPAAFLHWVLLQSPPTGRGHGMLSILVFSVPVLLVKPAKLGNVAE